MNWEKIKSTIVNVVAFGAIFGVLTGVATLLTPSQAQLEQSAMERELRQLEILKSRLATLDQHRN